MNPKEKRAALQPKTEEQKANAAIRAELKKKAKKEGDYALYLIPDGGQVFYRAGVSYAPGTVVKLPLSEDPSITWEAVTDEKEHPKATHSAGAPAPKRASDRDI